MPTSLDHLTPDFRAAFWARVDQSTGPNGCWTWTGDHDGDGYGLMTIGKARVRTHRLALMMTTGEEIPAGRIVRHACDCPPCNNPAHLLTGTHRDNAADRDTRGRNGVARLTPEGVARIRQLRAAGHRNNEVARMTGFSVATTSRVGTGKSWKWVKEPARQQLTVTLDAYGTTRPTK